jgi:poly-gamma-glutamate biosynthesis protein PgsC/CapC
VTGFEIAASSSILPLALGIFVGLVWSRRTGWSCGGVITPGLLALYASNPARAFGAAALSTLLLGVVLTPLLSLCARTWSLYGRERTGAAMLLSLLLRLLLSFIAPERAVLYGVGWVIPGLVAADADRQGVVMTLCGTISCSLFTIFCVTVLRSCGEMF